MAEFFSSRSQFYEMPMSLSDRNNLATEVAEFAVRLPHFSPIGLHPIVLRAASVCVYRSISKLGRIIPHGGVARHGRSRVTISASGNTARPEIHPKN